MFRGRDNIGIRALLRESLHVLYKALLDDAGNKDFTIPNDFYTVISNAIEYVGDVTISWSYTRQSSYTCSSSTESSRPEAYPAHMRHHRVAKDPNPNGHHITST